MKGWKSGFFLIDQRDIPHHMSWRHPDSAISDLKPPTVIASSNVAIPTPTLEDLIAATSNSKVLAKAEYSKKRRASTSGYESNDEESKDDNDACYKILIITPIRSLTTIHVGGNQVKGFTPSAAEGPHKTFTYKPKP
ncbi:hypothetical protein Tco_1270236 [Tanacetum coccineum]